jgi:hypothetical protein
MKKRIFVALILITVIAGGAFAEWYNSYAPGIDESKVLINAGVGVGLGYGSTGIPPISAAVDFKLPVTVPITLGAIGTFGTWGYDLLGVSYSLTTIGIGGRGNYHFNFVKNLDVYAGLTLGYVIMSYKFETGSLGNLGGNAGSFWYGGQIGARYFFTKNIGAYVELGYNALQIAGGGLTFKF